MAIDRFDVHLVNLEPTIGSEIQKTRPCLVVSPWSQHGRVPHAVYDHTSILKMIEWRFGLQPLSVRDAAARNLLSAWTPR